MKELEKELNRELNYSLMEYNEFKYRRDMTDVFLFHIIEGKKIVVVDEIGIYVDKFLNGTPYAKSFSTPKDSTTSNIDNSTDLKGLWRKKGDK